MKASLRATALAGLVHIQLLALSTLVSPALAKDECQPYSWGDPTHGFALKMANKAAADDGDGAPPKAGEVNCRQQSTSPSSVNYYTCTEMADEHDISVETFFVINPKLKKDCSDIQPNTKYCVNGCKSLPPVSTATIERDDFAGPSSKSTTNCVNPFLFSY